MALAVAKVTFSFAQLGYGWTENYFLDNPSSTLDAEFTKAEALASKRIALSGDQTKIPYIKISREDTKRDVKVFGYEYSGDPNKNSDAPQVALLVKRYAESPVTNSTLYMRGIWDEMVTLGGDVDRTNAVWLAKYGAYINLLFGSAGWGFVAKDPVLSGFSKITAVVANANGTITVTLADAALLAFAAGTNIKAFVAGVQGAAAVNGQNVFSVVDASHATTVKRIPMFPYQTGGKFTFTQPKFYRFASASIPRVVERKVGRPLYLSRGRRAARRVA